MDKKYIIGIVVVVIVILIMQAKKEALLPDGQYNVDAGCTWATNVDPMTSRYTSWSNTGAWITLDSNNDGNWEKFYYKSASDLPPNAGWDLLIENINNYGDDILTDGTYIYVAKSGYTKLEKDSMAHAIIPSCGGCTPSCSGKVCGDDGCGGSCGTCTSPKVCSLGQCVDSCTAETNSIFCSRLGKNCGSVTANDNCGTSRTVNCGTCSTGQTCSSGTCVSSTCWSYTEMISQLNTNWVNC